MGFIEKNLAVNEKIVYTGSLNWTIYLKGILFILVGIVAMAIFKGNKASIGFGSLLFIVGIVSIVNTYFHAGSCEFVVTNRRVMIKTGMVKRKLLELQLNRAEGLVIDQSILGRMFDFGSLIITSGGVTEAFPHLNKPFEFKRQVNNAIELSYPTGVTPANY